ncbi:LPS export ABC transporter permease LptF [Thiohalophilus thiocyanatoxydans]|uniref:Lipopolysaccharide export system permease protein LptF n=1 Tax=Thiohalophilus thiocyanatoxydans TaxID=381308 RepID=A0A4R8IW84_9GAMM|nr:LPS export ABC transporter permease LptF [Thiohalophilus thiocyanatoxydans]TDY01643.1 lipopolysaccharide export system permease protein [Thiohalophilus thiocyanatoxydans]
MIIARYLVKEVFLTFLAVALVLLLIALSAQLVGLFDDVARGSLQVDMVLQIFGVRILSLLVFILPLALYLAIILALGRLYRDSEMAAINACGIGTGYILRAVLGLALVVAVLQGVLSLQLSPWAEHQVQRLTAVAQARGDIQGISPGRFQEMSEGSGVLYVEEVNREQNRMHNVFVQQQREGGQSIIRARSGHQMTEEENGDRFMVLESGYRYEGEPGQDDYTVVEFEKHGIRIQEKEPEITSRKHKAIPTIELWKEDKRGYTAELQWRISSALMCLILAFVAVPLSVTSHRQNRYGKLAIAIVLYMVLTNLLTVSRNWLSDEKISPWVGLWWVHGAVLLLAVILLLRQSGIRHWWHKGATSR